MAVDINVNIKIEGLKELIEALTNLGKNVPAKITKSVLEVPEEKEVTKSVVQGKLEDFVNVKPAEVKPAKIVDKQKKEKKEDSVVDDFFNVPTESPKKTEPKEEKAEVTLDDLRELGSKISAANKTKEIVMMLKEAGYSKLTQIPEEERVAFYNKAKELVA